jgi:hypothetical protein
MYAACYVRYGQAHAAYMLYGTHRRMASGTFERMRGLREAYRA